MNYTCSTRISETQYAHLIYNKIEKSEEKMGSIKEKLLTVFGGAGLILYYIISLTVAFLPLMYLPIPIWAVAVITLLASIFPTVYSFLSPIACIWALVETINSTQNVWSVIYYVFFGAWALLCFVPMIIRLIMGIIKS